MASVNRQTSTAIHTPTSPQRADATMNDAAIGPGGERAEIKRLAGEIGQIAVQLMSFPNCQRFSRAREKATGTPSPSCIVNEDSRPLTAEEKRQGWSRRPFDKYDDNRLCNACSAYWHASLAEIRLNNIR